MLFWTTLKENAIRVLSGLTPSPSFWCRIGLHTWDRWETTKTGVYTDTRGRYRECDRECRHCGLPQLRTFEEKTVRH